MEEPRNHQRSFTLRLFGGFEAMREGHPIEGLHRKQADRLLAYLALHTSRWVEKEELANVFWGTRLVGDKDQNLRKSLAYLRQLLQSDAVCLEARTGAVRLVLTSEQADIVQFELACAGEGGVFLTSAQQIAEEPLLAGWSDAWIAPFRARYAQKLSYALSRRSEQSSPMPSYNSDTAMSRQLRHAGGIVPLESSLYIERDSDGVLIASMQSNEGIILVKGPRQTGKSSLLARGLQFACARNWDAYHIDFEQFPAEDLSTRDTLYLRLIALMAEQGGLEFMPESDWKPHLGAVGNLERFLRERVLKRTDAPILWILDGVDCLFKTDYYND